jgi:hypothetical protein
MAYSDGDAVFFQEISDKTINFGKLQPKFLKRDEGLLNDASGWTINLIFW